MAGRHRGQVRHRDPAAARRVTRPSYLFDVVPSGARTKIASELIDEQGRLLDWVISFAFETLGARHLDLCVVLFDHVRDE